MKNLQVTLIMLLATLFTILSSCSKEDENVVITPAAEIVDAFSAKYPGVSNVKWEILIGAYEAEFVYSGVYTENGQHISLDKVRAHAYISRKGKWQRSDFDVTRDYEHSTSAAIPLAVREAISATGWKVKEIKLFDWVDHADYYYVKFYEKESELRLKLDGTPAD